MSAAAASSVAAASAAAAGAATTTSSATGAAGFSLDERFNHNKDSSAWEDLDKLDPCAFDIGGTLVKIVWLQRGETEEASSSKGLQNAAGGSEPEKTPRRHFSRRDSARPVLFSGFKQSIAEALADIGEDAVEEDGEDSGDGRGVKATPGLPPIHRNSKTILASPGASLLSAGECASEDEDGKEEARKPILLSFARCQGIAAGVERVRNLGLGKQEGFKTMNVTGGGAFVHSARIKSDLGLDVHKVDEMKSLILGLNWLLTHSYSSEVFCWSGKEKDGQRNATTKGERRLSTASANAMSLADGEGVEDVDRDADAHADAHVNGNCIEQGSEVGSSGGSSSATSSSTGESSFAATPRETEERQQQPEGRRIFLERKKGEDLYPYLLVNVGSGTSIILVEGPETFRRVSGSTIGGGTYLGLSILLTSIKEFDLISKLQKDGRVAAVDLLVRDIYGEHELDAIGLSGDTIASSFGKVAREARKAGGSNMFAPEDITRSLLIMICNHLGQLAVLIAQLHMKEAGGKEEGGDGETKKSKSSMKIYFSGGFLREKAFVWSKIEHAVRFWSGGKSHARFIRHDGFLGALGALLSKRSDGNADK